MNDLKSIKAILFDIDGVLLIGNQVIPGAVETISYVKEKGLQCRFLTNTTTKPADFIYNKLAELKLPVEKKEIFSAPQAAVRFLRKQNNPKCLFIISDLLKNDFAEFEISEDNPDFIIIGDIGDKWSNPLLNKLFNLIINGAKTIALHKGKFWKTETGLQIDIGAYISGLEYVTGKYAIVTGKPSKEFFQLALDDLKVFPEETAIVGDDIESDIGGGQALGMQGILVKTGKYREDFTKSLGIIPKLIINSVKDLSAYL